MSNRRLVHTYTLQAEFDGESVLVADPYPLYPRAFLWAHLDDGVMETVVTNWGNDGLYMEGVGPSLVGRAISGLGPLQQINLGGALYFDGNGNLSYDPTALQTQIAQLQGQVTVLQNQTVQLQGQVTALQGQVLADETNYNSQLSALSSRAAADEATITSLQATVFGLQNQIYQILQSALFKPTAGAFLAGSSLLASALRMTTQLTPSVMSGNSTLWAAIGFQLPFAVSIFAGAGGIHATLGTIFSVNSSLYGAITTTPSVNLTQSLFADRLLTPLPLAGTGGSAAVTFTELLAAPATLAGSGNMSIALPVGLRGATILAGMGTSTARLTQTQTQLYATLAGGSNLLADLGQRSYYLFTSLLGSGGLNISLGIPFMVAANMVGIGNASNTILSILLSGSSVFAGTGTSAVDLSKQIPLLATLTGSGTYAARLVQTDFYSANLAGAGSLSAALTPSTTPVAVDRLGSYQSISGDPSTFSFLITVSSASKGALLLVLAGSTNVDLSGSITVKWGSQTMTLVGNAFDSTNRLQTLFYGLLSPTAGNQNITVTGANTWFVDAISFGNANQTSVANAFKNFNSSAITSTSTSVTVTSNTSSIVVGVHNAGGAFSSADHTLWFNDNTSAVGNYATGSASVTLGATSSGGGGLLSAGISVSP